MPSPKTRRRASAVIAAAALGAWPLTLSFAATTTAPASPGNFKGWAFDACAAPSAKTMDAWLKDKTNPYRGIGIYISGGLRACSQPNLTSSWVSHVQQTGWHLLPLTVGPQASCTGFSQVINANPANNYVAARRQGAAQADDAVAHAQSLGIVRGSTLFYDMENWHTGYNNCDASTLWFMSAWTNRLHSYGYAGGTYVSGLSGARLLNAMANATPSGFVLPDQIWTAEWNNQENTKSKYLDSNNWANHQRAHQYWGGHNATNSKITLNIDSNYVDLQTVAPIPAVVPDSAIGAPLPLPLPSPTASTPSPSATPTKPATSKPSPTPKPSPSPSPSPTKSASATAKPTATKTASTKPTAKPTTAKSTTVAKPVGPTSTPTRPKTATTSPSPTAKPTTKAPTPTVKPTAEPSKKPHKKSNAVNDVTSQLGSATGIKLPTLPAARRLAPKLADRVPAMVTRQTSKSSADAVTKKQQAKTHKRAAADAVPTPPAAAAAPQSTLQQPSMPFNAPQVAQEPSLMTKLWHGAEGILNAIGHALAAAGAWAGRGIGSMFGW